MLSRRTKKLIETISNAVVFYNGEMVNDTGVDFYSQSEIDFAERLNKEGKGYMSYGHYTVLVGNAYDGDRMVILLDQSGLDLIRTWVSYGLGWFKEKATIGLVMGYPVIGEIFIHRLYPLFTTNMTEYIQYVHDLSDGKTGKFTVNHLVLDKDKYVLTSAYLNSNYTEYITQSANILHGRFCRYNKLMDIPVKAKWVLQIEKEGIDLMPLAYTPSDVRGRIETLASKDNMDIVRMSNVIEKQLRRIAL